MTIKEVILENFMSYEYARIPFKSGVNVVCGPNGAGKSSILIGISVALGQSYTERSKRLRDLIRWGKDLARVTISLDNSPRHGIRPIQKIKKDYILLTRVLRRDGVYWFELNNKAATKGDVTWILSKLGIDPENMLVIMHQNMVEQFTVLSPQEKLRMVEAAVGFESYRRNVLDAQKKLGRILSEEESIGKLLESAEQTLRYWRGEYDRFQQKKQLIARRRFLERELAWAEVIRREGEVSGLKERIRKGEDEISKIETESKRVDDELNHLQEKLRGLKTEWWKIFENRLSLERERAGHESNISIANQFLEDVKKWSDFSREGLTRCRDKIERMEATINKIFGGEVSNPISLEPQLREVKEAYQRVERVWLEKLKAEEEGLKNRVRNSSEMLEKLTDKISDVQGKMDKLFFEMEGLSNSLVDSKIRLAMLKYQRGFIEKTLEKSRGELKILMGALEDATRRAEEKGPRFLTLRSLDQILGEIRVTDGHLTALADVSEDIERMYESYSKLYTELKEKARMVAENREKVLGEVRTRMETWRTVVQGLLDQVNPRYQAILSNLQARGMVKLVDEKDIEAAGLEVFVGFKGADMVQLNAYTQSGGERSTATIAFLLALQQHIRSPFRAIDEYDIHMDPKNREIISGVLISSVKGSDAQYIAITPSQVTFTDMGVNIITVQNVGGRSLVREVA